MPNYEKRLLSFLQQNPNIGFTPVMIASMWKRQRAGVEFAVMRLVITNKLKVAPTGELSLVTCK